jgi:hypothetical protein
MLDPDAGDAHATGNKNLHDPVGRPGYELYMRNKHPGVLIFVKSSFPAMRKRTVRMVDTRV